MLRLLTRKVDAEVSVGTYSAWESSATLPSARRSKTLRRPQGRGAYHGVRPPTTCFFLNLFWSLFSYEILFVSFVIQSQQRLCTTCCSAVCSSHALNRTISGCARELHRTEQHGMQRCRVADFGLRPSGMRKNQSSPLSLVTRRGQSMLSYWIYHWSWPLPRKYAGRVRVCFDPLKMSHSLIQNCCWITLQVSQWGWWL